MDIYAEVQSPDPADLINSPFGGRYCGPVPPRRRISLYRAIALSFYTSKNETTSDLFEGRYSFINECKSRCNNHCQMKSNDKAFIFLNSQPSLKLALLSSDRRVPT